MTFAVRALLVPLVLLSLLGAAAAPPNPTASSILARFRAVNGEAWRFHLSDSYEERREERDDDVHVETLDARRLERRCAGGICSGDFYDGSRFYVVGVNGTALAQPSDPGAAARTYETIAGYAFARPDAGAEGITVDERGTQTFGTSHVYVLGVTRGDGPPLEAWIDTKTYALRAIADSGGQVLAEFRDVRAVGPLRLPFEVRRAGAVVREYRERRIVPGPLDVPAGLVPSFSQQPDMTFEGDAPLVACTIAGQSVPCMIDTGSAGLAMSLELAERLKLEPFGAEVVQGVGSYATGFVRAGPLTVGSATFPPALYLVLHDIHEHGIDLVIGADVLANVQLQIDYASKTVRLSPPGAAIPGASVPLAFDRLLPFVAVRLGALDTSLAVDTGDASTIDLSLPFYDSHPELFAPAGAAGVSGVGGSSTQVTGRIADVGLPFWPAHGLVQSAPLHELCTITFVSVPYAELSAWLPPPRAAPPPSG